MKKFTLLSIVLSAAFCLTAAAQERKVVGDGPQVRTRTHTVTTPAAGRVQVKVKKVVPQSADVPAGYAKVILKAGDIWGDGSGYQMLLDADATAYGNQIPENGAFTASGDAPAATYEAFEYKIPENADGSLTTTNIIVNGQGEVTIPAGVYDYVVVNPTPGDRIWIASANGNAESRADDFEFKSECTYLFEVVQVGNNDGVNLTIDDPYALVPPTDITVNPGTDFAALNWNSPEAGWNVRYREYTDPYLTNRLWDLPAANIDEQLQGWITVNNDGDNYGWQIATANEDGTDYCFTSASYVSGVGALTPDNWLITPKVKLGGSLSFKAWGQDANWPEEVFRVYVFSGEEWNSVEDFAAISEDLTATAERTTYNYDLSAYNGPGYIAIRHYNITDMFRLNIDDVTVNVPDAIDVKEWTVEGIISERFYNITGLKESTEYEVGVQSVRDREQSDWSETIRFTTGSTTGITTLNGNDNVKANKWYTLDGRQLNSKPVQSGLYINNGKKVVIK